MEYKISAIVYDKETGRCNLKIVIRDYPNISKPKLHRHKHIKNQKDSPSYFENRRIRKQVILLTEEDKNYVITGKRLPILEEITLKGAINKKGEYMNEDMTIQKPIFKTIIHNIRK